MARYLLDADAVIDYLRGFPPTVELLRQLYAQGDTVAVCDIVVAEVYAGLPDDEEPVILRLLEQCIYLSISLNAAQEAGRWCTFLRRRGYVLAITDALVAATAKEHSYRLVSGDVIYQHLPEIDVVPLPRMRP